MVAHQPGHRPVGQTEARRGAEQQEAVLGHFGFQGPVGVVAPFRQQLVEADGVDHRPRQDMRPDLRALLDHDHRSLGV